MTRGTEPSFVRVTMDAVSLFLITTATILLLGVLGEIVFQRIGIPQPIWLIACGLLLGPLMGLAPRDDLAQLAPFVALPALVTAIAEVGTRLEYRTVARGLSRAGPLAGVALLGSLVIITITSFVAALLGVLPEEWGFADSLLLAAIVGAPCVLVVAPAMVRSRLAPATTQTMELATALSGAVTVIAVAVLIAAMNPDASGFGESTLSLLVSTSLGMALGLIWTGLWFGFLYALQSPTYAYPATLASLLVLYVITNQVGGSGPLAVLVGAVLIPNAPVVAKRLRLRRPVEISKDARGYRRLIALLVRSAFFLLLGLLLGPPWSLVGLGVLLALLLFPVRLPAVLVATKWSGWSKQAGPLAALSMPRGMLAGALALLPLQAGIEGAEAIPLTVFTVITVTTGIYAAGFPFARRKLPADEVVALDIDGELDASPVSIVTPDETSRRALMPSSTDETRASKADVMETDGLFGPLPPPTPPPRRDE